jgi:hypothetical protein
VAVPLTEVGDVRGGGLEDPQVEQPEQAEQGDEGEVVPVGGLAGSGQRRLEVRMGQPERWATRRARWPGAGTAPGTWSGPPSITQVR